MLITKRELLAFVLGGVVSPSFSKGGPFLMPLNYWQEFKLKFISRDGHLIDSYHKIVHSEGQGVSLVLSAFFKDRSTFYKVLNWTENNLHNRATELYSWRWEIARGVTDPNNATDGDLYIYWGLVLGAYAFKDRSLLNKAYRLQDNLFKKCVKSRRFNNKSLLVLSPGEFGFEFKNELVLNLSYYVRPALGAAAKLHNPHWMQVYNDGKYLSHNAMALSEHKLIPNWLSLKKDKLDFWDQRDPYFGYDAIRSFLWFDNLDLNYFKKDPLKAEVDLSDKKPTAGHNAPKGYFAIKDFALGNKVKLVSDLDYYSYSLVLLSFIVQNLNSWYASTKD